MHHLEVLPHQTVLAIAVSALLLLPTVLYSELSGRPFWTEQAMFRFGDEIFFTGVASCAGSAEDGRQRAYQAAMQEVLNYAGGASLHGVPIETQMIFEEPSPAGCPVDTINVWRLLRIPELPLDALAKRGHHEPARPHSSSSATPVRDLSLHVGMTREEVWERFGQPRGVVMKRGSDEVHYEYPRFGLTLALDLQGFLLHWHLDGPQSATASRASPFDWPRPAVHGDTHVDLPAIDLTDRLRLLEERSSQQLQDDAREICARRWPRDPALQKTCQPYEYEHLRHLDGQR